MPTVPFLTNLDTRGHVVGNRATVSTSVGDFTTLDRRLSDEFLTHAWQPRPADGKRGRRWFAIGDPQTTFANVLRILHGHELLAANGSLREDVGLVSIGDHFDFDFKHHQKPLADAGRDGANTLRWLAEHPPDQVVILIGNHDAARVMELAYESDESFAAARALSRSCLGEEPSGEKTRAFVAAYPRIATPELADRDYSSFATYQRTLVQQLLLARRMRLACLGYHAGKPVLLTHAGVTNAEVNELGVEPSAEALVNALETRLREAVARVRGPWERNELAALDLGPLHLAGHDGREGGGLLYHRASKNGDVTGSAAPVAPRRFHPQELPIGLVQVHGHTGHHKSLVELDGWHGPSATKPSRGGLRTLSAGPSRVVYDGGIQPARHDEATVYLIDIEMNHPDVSEYPLFELERVVP